MKQLGETMTPEEMRQAYSNAENPIVWVEAKLMGDKKIRAYMMRLSDARLNASLTNLQQDSVHDLRLGKMFLSGFMGVKSMATERTQRGYSDHEDAWKIDVQRAYEGWCTLLTRHDKASLSITGAVILDDMGIVEAAKRFNVSIRKVRELLVDALDTYADLRGWTRTRVRVPPTARQREVLDTINQYIRNNNGLAPTHEELCVLLNVRSTSVVSYLISQLEQRGWIARAANRARAIIVLP